MPKRYGQRCPVAKSLELLGERWTLLVIRDLLAGSRRFQDLQTSLDGIAPHVLSERLKIREEPGIVAREFYSEHPPRAAYVLTPRGRDLGMVVGALAVWGARHVHKDVALVHGECDAALALTYYCPKCDTRVSGRTVHLRARKKTARPRRAAAR